MLACKDDALVKAFYSWEYWQGIVPNLTRALSETLEDSRHGLDIKSVAGQKPIKQKLKKKRLRRQKVEPDVSMIVFGPKRTFDDSAQKH